MAYDVQQEEMLKAHIARMVDEQYKPQINRLKQDLSIAIQETKELERLVKEQDAMLQDYKKCHDCHRLSFTTHTERGSQTPEPDPPTTPEERARAKVPRLEQNDVTMRDATPPHTLQPPSQPPTPKHTSPAMPKFQVQPQRISRPVTPVNLPTLISSNVSRIQQTVKKSEEKKPEPLCITID